MSLTSVLASKHYPELREKLKKDFPRPKIRLTGDLIAPPQTKNYAIVGVAFDYLLRFKLAYEFKDQLGPERDWVAKNALDRLRKKTANKNSKGAISLTADKVKGEKLSQRDLDAFNFMFEASRKAADNLYKKWFLLYEKARENVEGFLGSGKFTFELAQSALVLAQLDVYYRSGRPDLLNDRFAEADLVDLQQLFAIIPADRFAPDKRVVLNPSFGKGSVIFSGADADVLIDDCLIEIKTTKKLAIERSQLNQLLCYVTAARIGNINGNEERKNAISRIGIYFSRHGLLWTIALSEFGTKAQFDEFAEWLPKYLIRQREENARDGILPF